MLRFRFASLLVLIACLTGGSLATHQAAAKNASLKRPRLVVMVVVDQFPYTYLEKYSQGLSHEGFFQRVYQQGAIYRNCHHPHAYTFTGPGHALLSTGASPNISGIINNSWYDRDAGKTVNCVADAEARVIGSMDAAGASPKTLLVPTLGDQMKICSGGASKVFTLSFKDRGAILMAGHLADGAFWFDYETGNWVTCDAYCDELPGYIRNINEGRAVAKYAEAKWELLLDPKMYHYVRPDDNPFERPLYEMSAAFPHHLSPADNENYYRQLASSPFSNDYTILTAMEIIQQERLGADEDPDFISLSLSANDYVGHQYGPMSLETQDAFYRTDRQLGDFARHLDEQVGPGEWVMVLSSDHGVDAIPEYLADMGLDARREPLGDLEEFKTRLNSKLAELFSSADAENGEAPEPFVLAVESNQVVLNNQHPKMQGLEFSRAQRVVRDELIKLPQVFAARTRDDLLSGPRDDALGRMMFRAFHAGRSGEVLYVLAPHQLYAGSYSTSHGSPWTYDTHVPLILLGAGIQPGQHERRVEPGMAVPTIARLLGIDPPAASTREELSEALQAN